MLVIRTAAANPVAAPAPITPLIPMPTAPTIGWPTPTPTPAPTPTATGDPVITAAGDIADDGSGDSATAKLVEAIDPDVALTTGDNAYPDGARGDYDSWYAPTWGAFKAKTRPVPGNHEYHVAGAAGYFDYFNGQDATTGPAGTRGQGYYSFDLGAWHLIALNSEISMSAGSAQQQWLTADLMQTAAKCTLAYWHRPRFTSGAEHGNATDTAPLWNALYAAKADVVLNGHNHQYERFAPQNPEGLTDPSGIREFVVGTGGAGLYGFGTVKPNSEARNSTDHGVLLLRLRDGAYDWSFKSSDGTYTDSGSTECHSAGPAPEPTPTPTATPTTSPTATPTPTPTPAPGGRYPMRGVFFRQSDGGFDKQVRIGFNLIDSSPGEVADLPAGAKGLTWVGDYGRQSCTWERSDAQIASSVQAHVGDPKVGVWFISDEPWQGGTPHCPNAPAQHKARTDLIHSIDPNAKTLVVLDGNSDQESLDQLAAWKDAADYVGVNAYICWQGQDCHYEWIDRIDQEARAVGLPLWGVIQAHGDTADSQQMCIVATGGGTRCGMTRVPTPAELHEEFEHWRRTSMSSYLVFSWRWPDGTPSLWLENHPELQDQLAIEARF
jgi:hypothetical protein